MHRRLPLDATPAQLTLAALREVAKDGVLTSGHCHRRGGARWVRRSTGYRGVVAAMKTASAGAVDVDGAESAALHGGVYRGPWKKRGRALDQRGKGASRELGEGEEMAASTSATFTATPRKYGELDDGEEQSSSPLKETMWWWSGDAVARK
jgi:hypothetical protein